MKFLKGLLIFIVIVALILVVVTFLLPSKSEMQRSQVIDASPELLFEQVNDLENWEAWSPWHQLDPNMSLEYSSDNPVGKGAWYKWDGNDQVGSGKLTILESNPNNLIKTEMEFMNAGEPAHSDWIFEPVEGGTKVTWTFDGDMSGIGKWFGLFMDSFLGPQYKEGLRLLDSVATSMPEKAEYTFEEFQLEDTWYVGYKVETSISGVSNKDHYSRGFTAVGGFLSMKEVSMGAAPMAIFHEYDEEADRVVMEMAIPTADSLTVPDSLTVGKVPGGPAIRTEHVGDYMGLSDAWAAFEKHNAENNIQPRWYPFEVYVTDPGEQPDSSKWVTQIVYPVN
ncbi:SRPBCC family protein [Halocola ammonii]